MKVVILAGGLGTRLMEETVARPKPMVDIGGNPILWHIMRLYGSQGFDDFIVAAGYKADVIEDYVAEGYADDWRVEVIDTGAETMTGGRLKRLQPCLGETFMATYGDGLADVDVQALLEFHRAHGRIATLTAVRPPQAHDVLEIDGELVAGLTRGPGRAWINGGFFVFEPALFDYLSGDGDVLESDALKQLASAGELMAYEHDGFWQCMDTLDERRRLEELWAAGEAPWTRLERTPAAINPSRPRS